MGGLWNKDGTGYSNVPQIIYVFTLLYACTPSLAGCWNIHT